MFNTWKRIKNSKKQSLSNSDPDYDDVNDDDENDDVYNGDI